MNTPAFHATIYLQGVLIGARAIIGVVFIAAALPKLRHPFVFLADVYAYELTGPLLSRGVAAVLPLLELVVGFLLLSGTMLPAALLTGGLMCAVFLAAQVSALVRGLAIHCGCALAGAPDIISAGTVMRAGLLFLMALAGFLAWTSLERCQQRMTYSPLGAAKS